MTTGEQPVRAEIASTSEIEPPTNPAGPPAETEETTAPPDAPPTIPSAKEPTMDIHPPHAIRTFKDFFIALLTVFIGILLALGLEALVEWQHHRALVREARANLALEIKANKETMGTYLQDIHKRQEELQQIVSTMEEIQRTKKLSRNRLDYNFTGHALYSVAWHAATTSGAVTYMDYGELQAYTDVYDTQQLFRTFEIETFKTVGEIVPRMAVLDKDPKTVPRERYEDIEREAGKALLSMQLLEGLAQATVAAYAKVEPH
jgi:hypothetical protein